MPIRLLDPQVASKIAAGEVVERPASVVKELVENAIDAGATVVHVELRGGCLELIRVVDNGCGIPQDEMALAFEHHATSKITSMKDLEAVRTLGFRGEALYSIAAVGLVTLFSRTGSQPSGSFVEVAEGRVMERGARGAPKGTTISVRNLFYNVPARRKFLKSADVESGRVGMLVNQFALAYPGVAFDLINNGRQVFQSTGAGSLFDVLVRVFGLETAKQMIPIGAEVRAAAPGAARGTAPEDAPAGEDLPIPPVAGVASGGAGVRVSGYVSQPHVTRANRQYLSFFVNKRCVQSPMMARAVEDAYHTLLPIGRHPIAVLDITLPPEELDVNVHPAKAEVKFLREGEVFVAVQRAVRAGLSQRASIPEFGTAAPAAGHASVQMPMTGIFRNAGWGGVAPTGGGTDVAVAAVPQDDPMDRKLPALRILGQMAQTYIIAEAPDGMYLIDQHTAHERILYERLMSEHAKLSVRSQVLLEPVTLDLTPRQQAMLLPRLAVLQEMGFGIEPFGERVYLLRAIPSVLHGSDAIQAILEIVDLLADEKAAPVNWQESLCITLACHGAVRAGQSLTLEEMRQLVTQLEQTDLPRTCPHGRPTLLHISQAQLEREFGRR
ncbi:MAG: DNA mismatch repair endonuclease MutL [Chloroflexota bacterium]|nr:DNA mismatch repair endonuclease MutL [Chloroflexota bacterium]